MTLKKKKKTFKFVKKRMATMFSKGKLSEIQEKKEKMGLKEGLLSKKH